MIDQAHRLQGREITSPRSIYWHIGLSLCIAIFCLASQHLQADEAQAIRLMRLESLIQQYPQDSSLLLRRGIEFVRSRTLEEANVTRGQLLELGAQTEADYLGAHLAHTEGELSESLRLVDRYLAVHPLWLPALEFRAELLEQLGRQQEALETYKTIVDDLGVSEPSVMLSEIRIMRRSNAPPQDILRHIDQRIREKGFLNSLQRQAIEIELEIGQTDGALQRMSLLHPKFRETALWKYEAAIILADAGRNKEALQFLGLAEQGLSLRKNTVAAQRLRSAIKDAKRTISGDAPHLSHQKAGIYVNH